MPMRLRRSHTALIAIVLAAAGIAAMLYGPRLYRTALVGSGYFAQTLCSGVFVSGRTMDDVIATNLAGPRFRPLRLFTPTVDAEARQVNTALLGAASQTAIYRDGLGCTLVHDVPPAQLRAETKNLFSPAPSRKADAEWPEGEHVEAGPWTNDFRWPDGVDKDAATRAVDAIFDETSPERPRGTRALVVVHHGRIVAERYAPGFDAQMPLVGWSMSKAAINALVGLRIKDGALSLDDAALLPQWRRDGDARGKITLGELMRMTSGLAFDEGYDNDLSDVARMLYLRPDTARFAASMPLEHTPGSRWSYSTGTTNIIAAVLRETFRNEQSYLRYPRTHLFGPLGMDTAMFAPDASGTLMGGAFLYASARDWARLGLLFLQDGRWQGTQLLPEGWIAYSTTPTPQSPEGEYGAQIWLKPQGEDESFGEPPMPEDAYYMQGYNGQVVVVVPSRGLVVVRLGHTPPGGDWNTARDLAPLVTAFPEQRRDGADKKTGATAIP